MKPLLLVLLAASLVANIVLARRSAPAGSATATASFASSTPSASEAGSATNTTAANARMGTAGSASSLASASRTPVGALWRSAETEQDLHRVVADLRAAGYPADVVRAVVNHLLKYRFASREPNAGQPFWKRRGQTPESVVAQAALSNERRALFEALLGPDARPSAMLDADSRERQYGPLANDKIDALAKIERDYSEMSAEAWAKRRGNVLTSMEANMQTQQLMEKDKMADMAAVLSPEELAQYEMRNSPSARTLINNLRNVDITADEYARLYQAQKAFDEANPRRATMDQAAFAQRQAAQMTFNEEARTVLGDTKFYAYLEGADFQYAQVSKSIAALPSVTPAATYQVYRLQNELQGVMAQATRGGPISAEKTAELRSTIETYNTRLEALIGTEAAETYRKQGSGRIFSSFRQVPAGNSQPRR
ncbi:MAG TPA: hypothetical protein VHN79_11150 [Lacunisphaera sp.]|nr:hypothetical protein [Lacunisphaera sp.]